MLEAVRQAHVSLTAVAHAVADRSVQLRALLRRSSTNVFSDSGWLGSPRGSPRPASAGWKYDAELARAARKFGRPVSAPPPPSGSRPSKPYGATFSRFSNGRLLQLNDFRVHPANSAAGGGSG